MTDITLRLRSAIDAAESDVDLLKDALEEIVELRHRRDALEEIMIVLARTRLPWDEDADPEEALPHFKERYVNAMREVSDLLGLDLRSTITRTEPRT